MRIYLDAAPVIYSVQRIAPFTVVDGRVGAAGVVRVASELTRLECIVLPLRNADPALAADFDVYFNLQIAEMVPFTRSVFQRAAEIRAHHGFKTPDALHLAAAVEAVCDVFLTNDHQLRAFPALTVEII